MIVRPGRTVDAQDPVQRAVVGEGSDFERPGVEPEDVLVGRPELRKSAERGIREAEEHHSPPIRKRVRREPVRGPGFVASTDQRGVRQPPTAASCATSCEPTASLTAWYPSFMNASAWPKSKVPYPSSAGRT